MGQSRTNSTSGRRAGAEDRGPCRRGATAAPSRVSGESSWPGQGVICRSPPEPFPGSDHCLCHQRVPLSGERGVREALAPRYCWSPCPVCPLAFMSLNWPIPDHWAQWWPFWKPRPGVSFKMASVPPSVVSAQPRPHCFPAGRTRSSPGMSVLSQGWRGEQEPVRWSPGPPEAPAQPTQPRGAVSSASRCPAGDTEAQEGKALPGALSQRKQGCPFLARHGALHFPSLGRLAGQWGQGQSNLRAGRIPPVPCL